MSDQKKTNEGRSAIWITLVFTLAAVGVGLGWPAGSVGASDEAHKQGGMGSFDLVGGLKSTKGCIGVETAKTDSGKDVIFAWFEDRKACLRWYYHPMHQKAMEMFFPPNGEKRARKPLSGISEDYDGPIMAVASITFTEDGAGKFDGVGLPISQISIELYTPVTGGLYLGGRFAPEGMKLPSTKDVEGDYAGGGEK